MAEVLPFRGLRFNLVKAGNPANLVAPPFFGLSHEAAAERAALSPNNVVHLGRGDYFRGPGLSDVGPTIREWRKSGLVRREEDHVLYLYERNYSVGATKHTSRGLLGLLALDDTGDIVRLPHRLDPIGEGGRAEQLVRRARANPGPVMAVYDDPEHKLETLMLDAQLPFPEMALTSDSGVEHRLFCLRGDEALRAIQDHLAQRSVILADGQGLYEGALTHARQLRRADPNRRTGPADYILTYFANSRDPALTSLPYHRTYRGLRGFDFSKLVRAFNKRFTVTPVRSLRDVEGMIGDAVEAGAAGPSLVVIGGGAVGRRAGYVLSMPREQALERLAELPGSDTLKTLPVTVLEHLVLAELLGTSTDDLEAQGRVRYHTDPQEAMQVGRNKDTQLLVMLTPVPLSLLGEVCDLGESLPAHTTTFFPPLLSGLVMHELTDE